jgi:oxygen-dependent protoporphyrinogen oxidase
MRPVAIVGAGITGLTAAFRLQEQNIPCVVYEASGHAGGVIRSFREDGYLAESGPNAITEISRNISGLVKDAGLSSRRLYSNPAAHGNFLLHGGRLVPAPSSILKFITTSLFSARGKLRVCLEPFIAANRSRDEETLACFVSRRLGPEFLEAVINPFVAGIYAGDPALLSVRHGFPKLHSAEQLYGSLFRAQIFGARARQRSGEIPKIEAKKFSFDRGLEVLPGRLAEKLGAAVELQTPVLGIEEVAGEWSVRFPGSTGDPARLHSAVLLAVPAHKMAGISFQAPGAPANALAPMGEIVHPPVASVVLGFNRSDVRHPLAGFGFLVPASENRRILGAIFSSSVFSGRAPSGHVTITTYIGGCRNPDLALQPPGQVVTAALSDLREILGITGSPTFEHCSITPQAIPQYNVGYERYKQTMERLETAHPGLFFAGTCKDGISLGNSILSGHDVARRIRACISRLPQLSATAA